MRRASPLLEQSPLSIFITDPSGVIEYVNSGLLRVTGDILTPDEVLAASFVDVDICHDDCVVFDRLGELLGEFSGDVAGAGRQMLLAQFGKALLKTRQRFAGPRAMAAFRRSAISALSISASRKASSSDCAALRRGSQWV